MLLTAGVSSIHQDEPFERNDGEFKFIGRLVSTKQIDESLPEDLAFVIHSLKKVGEIDYEKLAREVRRRIEEEVSKLLYVETNLYPFETKPEVPLFKYFETSTPVNPYPSISGTHKVTLTPNRNITVSKLYTYPCSRTGGHTEYVRVYGHGVDGSASWNGYSGDWHNITFDSSFTLESGKMYNYTIRTGSYPQIIHEREFDAIGGKITCSEFIDVNGRSYNDWIPAISLE